MFRRIGIVVFALVALVGIAITSLAIWLSTESGYRYVSAKLTAEAKSRAGLDIKFASLEMDLFPPRVVINGASVKDEKDRFECDAQEIHLSLDVLALIRWKLRVEEIYLGSPICSARLNKADLDAILGAPDTKAKSGKGKLKAISSLPDFEAFSLSDGSFELAVNDEGRIGVLKVDVKGLGLDVTGGEQALEVRGLVEKVSGDWEKDGKKVSESIDDFEFRTAVSESALDFRQLSAKVAGAKVSLREARVSLPFRPDGAAISDLHLEVPLEIAARLPIDLPKMAGVAGFNGQVSISENGKGKVALVARGKVSLEKVKVGDFVIGDLESSISLTPNGVSFSDSVFKTADGVLKADGNVAFDEEMSVSVKADLDGIELAHLLEQVDVDGSCVTQKMTGTVSMKGSLKPFRLDGSMRFEVIDHTVLLNGFRSEENQVILRVPRTIVQGQVAVTDRYLHGKDLSVRSGETVLGVDMRVNFGDGSWELKANSRDFHLDDVGKIAGLDVKGHGPVSCRISGLLWDPKIVGSVSMNDFKLEGFDLGKVATGVTYDDLVLTFDGTSIHYGRSRCSVNEVVLDFNSPNDLVINTKIEAEQVAIEDLAKIFHIDTSSFGSPQGLVFGRAPIEYRLTPERLRVDVDLVHDVMTIFGEKFGPDVIKATWDQGNLTVTEFGLTKGSGTISVTGALRSDGTLNFMGVATDIDSASIDNVAFKRIALETIGQAFVVVEGTVDRVKGSADLRFGETVHNGVAYRPSTLALELDGSILTGRGKIAGDSATLEHVEVDFDSKRFNVEGFVRGLDLVRFFGVDTGGRRASLNVVGEMALSGRLDLDSKLRGYANISRIDASVGDFGFTNLEPLRVDAEGGRMSIKTTRFEGPDVLFDLKGDFEADKLDLGVKGAANLDSLSDFVGAVESSKGRLDFEVRAKGPWGSPSLLGSANLNDGEVRIKGFPHAIEQIRGQISMGPKAVRFFDFTARSAGGELKMGGEVRIDEGKVGDYRFNLALADLELAPIEDLSFVVSTARDGLILRNGANGGLPIVTGDLEVRNLSYTKDIRVLELSDLDVDRLSGAKVRTSKPLVLDKKNDVFEFDIRLHGNRNLQARNSLFDVDFAIDDVEKPLRLVGTNQTFGFLGQIVGKEGEVSFADKRFELKYASVEFDDPLRPDNPRFRVAADGQIRDWKVTMTAEGTVEEYELGFTSQPYLPKEDIVFVILTGLTRAEHRQFGSGLSLGAPILSQLGPGRGEIPVELRIYSEYSEKAGTDTTRMELGRWLTEDVWVSFSSGVGQDRDVGANLDYKINNRFSIITGYEDDNESQMGNLGLDLRFRLEF